jgi:hypothetical protein
VEEEAAMSARPLCSRHPAFAVGFCPICKMEAEKERPAVTLAGFLLARIAEDEDAASYTHHTAPFECDIVFNARVDPGFGWTCTCGVPARVLAECDAKREIIERWRETARPYADSRQQETHEVLDEEILPLLAVPYKDHPDFDSALYG